MTVVWAGDVYSTALTLLGRRKVKAYGVCIGWVFIGVMIGWKDPTRKGNRRR